MLLPMLLSQRSTRPKHFCKLLVLPDLGLVLMSLLLPDYNIQTYWMETHYSTPGSLCSLTRPIILFGCEMIFSPGKVSSSSVFKRSDSPIRSDCPCLEMIRATHFSNGGFEQKSSVCVFNTRQARLQILG